MSNDSFYVRLYKLSQKMQASSAGRAFVSALYDTGVYSFVSDLMNKRQATKAMHAPTKNMLESRKYFECNADRVRRVVSWLSDDQSRRCYLDMIDFRCNSNVNRFPPQSRKTQYFWNDYFVYTKEEVLVDCGAFTGDTIRSFKKAIKHSGGAWKKIIGFEPDACNYKILRVNHPDAVTINAGVWSTNTTLTFSSGSMSNSFVQEIRAEGDTVAEIVKVPVRSIDLCEECKEATLIKMDIEGSEQEALIGAEKIIVQNKPKLAICIYHSDEDMIRLAEWIHERVPEYKLYVQQHNNFIASETVLYATI